MCGIIISGSFRCLNHGVSPEGYVSSFVPHLTSQHGSGFLSTSAKANFSIFGLKEVNNNHKAVDIEGKSLHSFSVPRNSKRIYPETPPTNNNTKKQVCASAGGNTRPVNLQLVLDPIASHAPTAQAGLHPVCTTPHSILNSTNKQSLMRGLSQLMAYTTPRSTFVPVNITDPTVCVDDEGVYVCLPAGSIVGMERLMVPDGDNLVMASVLVSRSTDDIHF
jgi:hypothetical protein